MMSLLRNAVLIPLVGLALLSSDACDGNDCKAIGLEGPAVHITVPEALSNGTTSFRVCADDVCEDGLVSTPQGGGIYSVGFVDSAEKWGASVTLTIAGFGTSNVSAMTKVQRHAFYPGCVNTPVVSARLDSSGKLEATSYTFNDPQD